MAKGWGCKFIRAYIITKVVIIPVLLIILFFTVKYTDLDDKLYGDLLIKEVKVEMYFEG